MLKYILIEKLGDLNDVFTYKKDDSRNNEYDIIGNKNNYLVILSDADTPSGNIFYLAFDVAERNPNEMFELTNDTDYKDIITLFNTIYKILLENLEVMKKSKGLYFSADKDEKSRVRLYDRFIGLLSDKLKAKYEREETPSSVSYKLYWK